MSPHTDAGELLPCPFCGHPPAVEITGFHGGGRTIFCADNDCMGPSTTASNVDDATVQWNRRAGVSQPEVRTETPPAPEYTAALVARLRNTDLIDDFARLDAADMIERLSRPAQASQELIADLQYEAGIYQSLYENAIERCAKIAKGGLVCRSCGYVGGITECCERTDFDGASNDQIAAGIRALSVPSAHRVGEYSADYSPASPEEIAKDEPSLTELYAHSRPVQRCPVCDWPMAESMEKGCIPGNCCYRPDDPAEQERIRRRRAALSSTHRETL